MAAEAKARERVGVAADEADAGDFSHLSDEGLDILRALLAKVEGEAGPRDLA